MHTLITCTNLSLGGAGGKALCMWTEQESNPQHHARAEQRAKEPNQWAEHLLYMQEAWVLSSVLNSTENICCTLLGVAPNPHSSIKKERKHH